MICQHVESTFRALPGIVNFVCGYPSSVFPKAADAIFQTSKEGTIFEKYGLVGVVSTIAITALIAYCSRQNRSKILEAARFSAVYSFVPNLDYYTFTTPTQKNGDTLEAVANLPLPIASTYRNMEEGERRDCLLAGERVPSIIESLNQDEVADEDEERDLARARVFEKVLPVIEGLDKRSQEVYESLRADFFERAAIILVSRFPLPSSTPIDPTEAIKVLNTEAQNEYTWLRAMFFETAENIAFGNFPHYINLSSFNYSIEAPEVATVACRNNEKERDLILARILEGKDEKERDLILARILRGAAAIASRNEAAVSAGRNKEKERDLARERIFKRIPDILVSRFAAQSAKIPRITKEELAKDLQIILKECGVTV